MLAKVRVESGLTGTLQQISREVVSMYGAARLVIAAQEIHSQRTFLGEFCNSTSSNSNGNGEPSDFKWLDSVRGRRKSTWRLSGRGVLRGEPGG